jgi:hypothetical protein
MQCGCIEISVPSANLLPIWWGWYQEKIRADEDDRREETTFQSRWACKRFDGKCMLVAFLFVHLCFSIENEER